MSDRDEVRALAEELIHAVAEEMKRGQYPQALVAAHLTAFLDKREADLQGQLHRALGEGAKLREVVRKALADIKSSLIPGGVDEGFYSRARATLNDALASSPLSERAGR